MTQFIAANWSIVLAVAIVLAFYLWGRWQKAKGDPKLFAEALAHDAVETALVIARQGADVIDRHDLDNVVAFLYAAAPPIVRLIPLMEIQERAWGIWLNLHAQLDVERRSLIKRAISQGRTARARVGAYRA